MPAGLLLTRLRFRAGSRPGGAPLDITPSTVTVLVGPNGSGKSRSLAEIDNWTTGRDGERLDVLDEIEVSWPTYEDARTLLEPYEVTTFQPGRLPPKQGSFA